VKKGHADFLQSQSQEIFYYFYILRSILQASDCDELEKVPLKARVTNFSSSLISPLMGRQLPSGNAKNHRPKCNAG
jgi:hypothetical protein